MPKGSKGWPIVSTRYSNRDLLGRLGTWSFGAFLIAIWIGSADSPGAVVRGCEVFVVAISALAALLFLGIYAFRGRIHCTPTSMMWVPLVGQPRWVLLADATRMRRHNNDFVFDVGYFVKIPRPLFRSSSRSAETEHWTVLNWLNARFKEEALERPRDLNFSVGHFGVGVISLCIWIKFVTSAPPGGIISPAVARAVRAMILPQIPLMVVAWTTSILILLVLPIGVIWIAGRCIGRLLGFRSLAAPNWRMPVDSWQGFEVQAPLNS